MIKTYIKHLMIDKLLNIIFDNLYKTFDIIPPLVIGKTYRMLTFENESHRTSGNPDKYELVSHMFTFVYNDVKICDIDTNGICTFSGGYRSVYDNYIFVNCLDLGNEPFKFINTVSDLVMVIE